MAAAAVVAGSNAVDFGDDCFRACIRVAGTPEVDERKAQRSYWEEHSRDLTVEAMMLDSRATDLDREERPEVLSLLPSYEGKSVLELGAGIGRFTGELAKTSRRIHAVDFIESVIKKNKSTNGHSENTSFTCADVTSPDLMIEANSVDLIFSNWLLMYLSDEEIHKLVERMMKWLKVGGYIFFRESCFHQSGDSERKLNPTHYRDPRFYTKVRKQAHPLPFHFAFICWLWQKVDSAEDGGFQSFLDNVQYKASGILRYERIFGDGYVSTGGVETTKEFVDKLDLKPGQKVLDVGCGIGGGDFYMAEKYDTHVVGIDLSINMIMFALERAVGHKCSVEFEVTDCTTKTYPDNTFDVIYSRDTILHIQVLISDYCRSPGEPSEEFAAYIKQRGYDLHDVEAYGQMLKNAGFHDVVAEDRSDQFLSILQKELVNFEKNKDSFLSDFSQEDYDDIVNGWKAKVQRSSAGEQRWGLFIATK
ncbi:hypothetical protein PR202_gb05105 [Eleusine coracana subsp. coracana]|uniref:phosphoethanolamine N-methyltransferase n=1 Tax=Eleusine coracana subsp. coracana TaxID=191504 RepID=A0AAV5E4L4_ELECO|nr:hypothetical protein PR202_gb05105 [Eleusine coracana subsp. coracana]